MKTILDPSLPPFVLVGLSGGIGAGKSTASALFQELGIPVVDADALARGILAPGMPALDEVINTFGPDILTDGILDRAVLGRIVFSDPKKRASLEAITHPRIADATRKEISAAVHAGAKCVLHDVPLLVETADPAIYDLVIDVYAPLEVRLERLWRHRKMDRSTAVSRMKSQATQAQRDALSNVRLVNDGSLSDLRENVHQIYQEDIRPLVQEKTGKIR